MIPVRTRYGPLVVALFFGIAIGTVLLVTGKILSGLFVLGLAVFVVALALSSEIPNKLFVAGIAAIICGGAFGYFAVRSEITGRAIDYHSHGRIIIGHAVTRRESPEKFREATNYKWGLSLVCLGVGATMILFRRKLASSEL